MFFWSTDPSLLRTIISLDGNPFLSGNNLNKKSLLCNQVSCLSKWVCCCSGSDWKRCSSRLYIFFISSALLCSPESLGVLNFRLWVAPLNHSSGLNSGKVRYNGFLEPILLILCLVLTLIQILLDNSQSKPWAAQPTAEQTRRGGVKVIGKP